MKKGFGDNEVISWSHTPWHDPIEIYASSHMIIQTAELAQSRIISNGSVLFSHVQHSSIKLIGGGEKWVWLFGVSYNLVDIYPKSSYPSHLSNLALYYSLPPLPLSSLSLSSYIPFWEKTTVFGLGEGKLPPPPLDDCMALGMRL